ncbi:MAG TPA: L,D-transpeptidase [Opitutaceae bacterium]|nr:L,D-transpeptidase [Opitutaceae bacterium]
MELDSKLKRVIDRCAAAGIKPANRALHVSIASQTMQFFEDGRLVKAYVISTGRNPASCKKGSMGTPTGLHAIAEKIGAGTPPGIVFVSRASTGFHFSEGRATPGGDNLVTTRILWLRGLEPGVNAGGDVDTHDRYVYIHGTNHEDRLGTPQSAGCVLMNNLEIIELFDRVRTGDPVLIELE